MFVNDALNNHILTSSTIKSQSAIIAEWNMNLSDNILKIGNYRYRPLGTSIYNSIPNSYDPNDAGEFYTGATDADIVLDGGIDDSDEPILFKTQKQKEKILFSLEDCFGRFRPRSGINKVRYGVTQFLHHSNPEMANRPRYYMASKDDKFKYWSSYRTEDGQEYGIASKTVSSRNYIDDAAPFVVYDSAVPANRIVVKMQTNVGAVTTGSFANIAGSFNDPMYGYENQTTPVRWKIQYLVENSWVDAKVFDEYSIRPDGSPIVNYDGYVELVYGLVVPEEFREQFFDNGIISSENLLPDTSSNGQAFLVVENPGDIGIYHVWNGNGYAAFKPTYDWQLSDEVVGGATPLVTELGNPIVYTESSSRATAYREFKYLSGLRVVAETMNKIGSTFDLIELSPRLAADLSGLTTGFNITKPMSDLGIAGMPVGQLLASVGSIKLFDYDDAFNENNFSSVISNHLNKNLQVKFYEIIADVDGIDYYVPIKTMYAETSPAMFSLDRTVTIELRDLFFLFESTIAPQILIPDVSLSYAISILLDSIGFSNYAFYRTASEQDMVIPYFYIGPDESVAQVLEKLAISTQTAMFFDEYNNFICMSKNYIMPSLEDRATDFVLYGTVDSSQSGIRENLTNKPYLSNIKAISSKDRKVFNSGKISFTTRYIQKSQATIKQAYLSDREKTWIYKPSLLWEVSASETTKSINEETSNAGAFSLSAIPLNSNLSTALPVVVNHQIKNNVIDLGEGVYWLGRNVGYFYANGEVIKYDAVEYSVSGEPAPVWISSTQEYQTYFSRLPFNGKMYPTGRVRIYSEPNYETVGDITRMSNGPVAKHGRGQFGTEVTSHFAGLDTYWKSNDNVHGCNMESSYLFSPSVSPPTLSTNAAGKNDDKAKKSIRTDLIKNYLSTSYASELNVNSKSSIESQTVQSSALVFEGPSFETNDTPINFISTVTKTINSSTKKFVHFGTRMRIIGKINNDKSLAQAASGEMSYFKSDSADPEFSGLVSGGSGGITILQNKDTNVGYYYEIIALDSGNVKNYSTAEGQQEANIFNIVFYKINSDSTGKAIPTKLWSGLSNILVDTGNFVGQERVFAQDNQTVYDLAIEYENIGSSKKFYLYLNDTQIATVTDSSPLPEYNNFGLFVRGSSKCMFENIYALGNNYSQNSGFSVATASKIFANNQVTASESFNKYAISGIIQSTYLSGISSNDVPRHNIYYDEFGTIMREAAYFNIKYDKAYPALYSKISPTFNKLRGYTVSGYLGGAYGAEFMVFNASNTTLRLDEQTGNYLRIQGITFTQSSQHDFTVDEFYDKKSDFSDPDIGQNNSVGSLLKQKDNYRDIKYSRSVNGIKDFSLQLDYLQTYDSANELMSWLTDRIMKPKKSVGVKIFATPTIQLGDIIEIDYSVDGIDQVSVPGTRFVVYNIEYSKDPSGPEMTIFLSEV